MYYLIFTTLLEVSQFFIHILWKRTLKSREAKKWISQYANPDLSNNKGILPLTPTPYSSAFHLSIYSSIHLHNI